MLIKLLRTGKVLSCKGINVSINGVVIQATVIHPQKTCETCNNGQTKECSRCYGAINGSHVVFITLLADGIRKNIKLSNPPSFDPGFYGFLFGSSVSSSNNKVLLRDKIWANKISDTCIEII